MRNTLLVLGILLSKQVLAITYFGDDNIKYWDQYTPAPKEEKKVEAKEKKKLSEFDWKKQLDPKNDEFFQEGDHKPPKALMELARNPTDENIKNWFKLVKKKNDLMARLQSRLSDYLVKNQNGLSSESAAILQQKRVKLDTRNIDYKRFRFRMYFESSCPHCKKMMKTLEDLQDMGFYVEIRQIDRKRLSQSLPFPVTPATKEELKERNINAWPVLFVADTTKKLIYRINGYHTTNSVLATLQSK